MGVMLPQESKRKENVIYCLSKKFLDYEVQCTQTEKMYIALVWATKKLSHYAQ